MERIRGPRAIHEVTCLQPQAVQSTATRKALAYFGDL
jgi:hypothetical protein